jgi:threonylcarbamoyladenosine tRNA methylthiotransferase CDKAL1
MIDIEDMTVELRDSSPASSVVMPRVMPESKRRGGRGGREKEALPVPLDNVPGTQQIYMKTYGCSHNVSDSEYMQGMLTTFGYRITSDMDSADLWLVNSCTVKDPSQSAFMHIVQRSKNEGHPLVVAGCVPQGDRTLKGLEHVSVVGIQQIDRVLEVVEETLKGNVVRLLSKKSLPRLDLPKVRRNRLIEIVPLSTGCLGACTYCKTRHARGKLGSYSLEALESRVGSVLGEGIQEIWLSSEDTGAYGLDLGIDITVLLERLTSMLATKTKVMLRVGMTNPPYILKHLEAIAEVLNHPSVFAFLHVPVQAGGDPVLAAMNREYTVAEFRQVADMLIARVPSMIFATDIICGFPTETEEDFDETLKLIEHYKFPVVNISQFYPRPGTPAAKMKRLPTALAKARSRKMTKLFMSYKPYEWLAPPGCLLMCWVGTELSSNAEHSVAHSKAYYKVLIPRDDTLHGCRVLVRVTEIAKFHVVGVVLRLFDGEVGGSREANGKDGQADIELFMDRHHDGRCMGDGPAEHHAPPGVRGGVGGNGTVAEEGVRRDIAVNGVVCCAACAVDIAPTGRLCDEGYVPLGARETVVGMEEEKKTVEAKVRGRETKSDDSCCAGTGGGSCSCCDFKGEETPDDKADSGCCGGDGEGVGGGNGGNGGGCCGGGSKAEDQGCGGGKCSDGACDGKVDGMVEGKADPSKGSTTGGTRSWDSFQSAGDGGDNNDKKTAMALPGGAATRVLIAGVAVAVVGAMALRALRQKNA